MQAFKPPKKPSNKDRRVREHLFEVEVDQLLTAIRQSTRYPKRNALMVLMCFQHGLRVSELINLKWAQLDFSSKTLHVVRLKNGIDTVHPLSQKVQRSLNELHKKSSSPFVFVSERQTRMEPRNFAMMLQKAGIKAGLPLSVHPHMLRHACGYYLQQTGHNTRSIQLYLGHKDIRHTVLYTQLSPETFAGLFD